MYYYVWTGIHLRIQHCHSSFRSCTSCSLRGSWRQLGKQSSKLAYFHHDSCVVPTLCILNFFKMAALGRKYYETLILGSTAIGHPPALGGCTIRHVSDGEYRAVSVTSRDVVGFWRCSVLTVIGEERERRCAKGLFRLVP